MSKVWTEFKKSRLQSEFNCLAINGIEMEIAQQSYPKYCIAVLNNILPKQSDMNYFALIVEEVEFPTRVDNYKKVWGKNKDIINSAEYSLSQEYTEEINGATFFYGVIEIKGDIPKNIIDIINRNPDALIFGEITKLGDLDIPAIFQQQIITVNDESVFRKRGYPIHFQMIDSGFEICLYVFINSSFSSNIVGNTKIDTERLKIELKEVENESWKIDGKKVSIYSTHDDRFGITGDGIEVPDFFWMIGCIEGKGLWIDLSNKNHCVYEQTDQGVNLLFSEIGRFVEACEI
ncbi:hypothetical protein HCA69_11395 [Listeria grandensis]|uniref:Uncharacterized protein n=1 Tax=Listeria grandensis TaxID=1494963 RepID=A0A7X0Y4Q0_9LIST|nr:hypothetical protein [Listeria grandensis]MBC1936976.1 hypothetical protein [Listeria grandensis]